MGSNKLKMGTDKMKGKMTNKERKLQFEMARDTNDN